MSNVLRAKRDFARRQETLPTRGVVELSGPIRDAAEHRRSADALHMAEERQRLAVEAGEMGTWFWDLRADELVFSPRAKALFGFPPEAVIDYQSFLERLHPDDRQETHAAVQRCLDEGTDYDVEYRALRAGSGWRWLRARGSSDRDSAGKAIRMQGVVYDIDAHKTAIRKLTESEARFAALFRQTAVGIAVTDTAGRFLMVNPSFCEMLGRSEDELLRLSLRDVTHPDDMPESLERTQRLAGSGESFAMEKRYLRKDGAEVWVNVSVSTFEDGTGERHVSVARDISERKHAEKALREETRVLGILNRTGAMLAAELDLERLVQAVTDAGVELSGAEFGAFFYNTANDEGEPYTLYALSGAPREAFENFPLPRNSALFGPTFRGGGIVRCDDVLADPRYGRNTPYRGMPEGHLPVRSYLAVPVISRTGEVLGGLFFGHGRPGVFTERVERLISGIAAQAAIAMDNAHLYRQAQEELAQRSRVEEQLREAVERQTMLAQEFHHRLQNKLTIVQAVINAAARRAKTIEEFNAAVGHRIAALARTNTLLLQGGSEGAPLEHILRMEFEAHQGGGSRIISEGPALMLPSELVVPLAMAVHELTTNATKYGALSNSTGQVSVAWQSKAVGDERTLELNWIERGGPPVSFPEHRGFGSVLLERVLASGRGASVEMDFAPEGLRVRFRLALT